MLILKFIGETVKYKVKSFDLINKHVVACYGLGVSETKGFTLSRVDYDDNWDYSKYTTIYKKSGDDVFFSDDGSKEEDQPIPPEPQETLEEAKKKKIEELNAIQQNTIAFGVEVDLSTGTERFTLTTHDQESLLYLQSMVEAHSNRIPWHNADQSKGCKYYNLQDMIKILDKSRKFISYHVAFFRDLRIYVNSLTDIDRVNAVEYDLQSLPQKYRSIVLKDLINAIML